MKIDSIEAILVDLPTIRPHKLASQTISTQTPVIVRMKTACGIEGIGEGTTIGGLSYGEESPEGIKLAIDLYIAPLLIGRDARKVGRNIARIEQNVKGNRLAKSAIETALLDVVTRHLGVPLSDLFGGARHSRLEVGWGLATGDASLDIDEAERALSARQHRFFKIKMGAQDPASDLERAVAIKRALGDRASIRVDANQAWSEVTATRMIAALEDAGIELIEQPILKDNVEGLGRLASKAGIPIMADEAVATPRDAFDIARRHAADVFSLKIGKSGGLHGAWKVATIAEAAGISLYGGTMLEGSIGSVASLHLFASLPEMAFGCELFGPLLLEDDVVVQRPKYADFSVELPTGPGLGVELDPDKLAFFRRDRKASHFQAIA